MGRLYLRILHAVRVCVYVCVCVCELQPGKLVHLLLLIELPCAILRGMRNINAGRG